MAKYAQLLLLLLALLGCSRSSVSRQTPKPKSFFVIKSNGTLKIKTANRICFLADDALDYKVYPSSDSKTIAVETLLLSNLTSVRIYKKVRKGCYKRAKSIAISLWRRVARRLGVTIEEIENPRMLVSSWRTPYTLEIELRGRVRGKAFRFKEQIRI